MGNLIKIVIAESSFIIRKGVVTLLKHLDRNDIQLQEVDDFKNLKNVVDKIEPDILIVNPISFGIASIEQFKTEINFPIKYVALVSSLTDSSSIELYDQVLSIYDSVDQIKEKFVKLTESSRTDNEPKNLTSREKDVIVEVVKGLSNKQIADALYLSIHTVVTHRRNIASKLQIHSPAGLTIYAIINKLVQLDDIKKTYNNL